MPSRSLPVYLLSFILALSPVTRFTWDLWSQSLLHIAASAALILFIVRQRPSSRYLPLVPLFLFLAGTSASFPGAPDAASVRNNLLTLFDALIAAFIISNLPHEERKKLFIIPVMAGFFFSVMLLFFTLTRYNAGYLDPEAVINPNVIAGYLTLVFPLSLLLWESHGRAGRLAAALIFAGILLTHSRAAIVFSSAAAAIYLWQKGGTARRIAAFSFPVLLGALVYATSIKLGQDSLGSRLMWWKSALNIFLADPVNGGGWANFGSLFPAYKAGEGLNTLYAHNVFLQVLSDGGLLSFVPFCILIYLFFRSYKGPSQNPSFDLALRLSAGSFLALNLFDYSFFIPAVTLLFFSILGASFPSASVPRERPLVPVWAASIAIVLLAVLFLIPLQANRHYGRAIYLLKNNDPAAAEKALSAARSLDPLPYQYYSASAGTAFARYASSKDPAELQTAIARQRQAIDRFPVNSRLWADLSWLFLSAGDKEAAASAMQKAQDIHAH